MATAEALESLALFEETMHASADAAFRAQGRAAEFISFVWFLLASEEELSGVTTVDAIDSALRSTLAFKQLPTDLRDRWVAVSHQVASTYNAAGPRRRAWSKTGTSVGSATEIDRLAAEIKVAVDSSQDEFAESAKGALYILRDVGALDDLLALPESPGEWRFRATRGWQSAQIPVDPGHLLRQWISGRELGDMANDVLADVADPGWRIEQIVDAVTGHFEHYLAWTVGSLVELVNDRLAQSGSTRRLCPQLGSLIRYGVSTESALALMLGGVRSRRLAAAVATAWEQQSTGQSIREWLRMMSLPEWRDRFAATASEMLDLLDVARVRHRSLVRTLLEQGVVDVPVEAIADHDALAAQLIDGGNPGGVQDAGGLLPVTLAAVQSDPAPQRFGLHSDTGALLAVVSAGLHGEVDAIVNTGVGVSSFLAATPGGVRARIQLDLG